MFSCKWQSFQVQKGLFNRAINYWLLVSIYFPCPFKRMICVEALMLFTVCKVAVRLLQDSCFQVALLVEVMALIDGEEKSLCWSCMDSVCVCTGKEEWQSYLIYSSCSQGMDGDTLSLPWCKTLEELSPRVLMKLCNKYYLRQKINVPSNTAL